MKSSKTVNRKVVSNRTKSKKSKKPSFISIVDYTFLISLALSIIFGIQTNAAFMWPFTIMLLITVICMMIILINAIYVRIFKKNKRQMEK